MADDSSKDRVKDLRQEAILCRIKYHNDLADIAFDPKFLTYPFESTRFVQYAATSLERNHKHELLCEADVGVVVDLIDPDIFKTDKSVSLHPDDERLLEDDDSAALNARKSRHQRSVSWLRKTEYISTELYNKWNKAEKVETKLGHNIKRKFNDDIVYRDRESQISAIQATFNAVQKPIKRHYSKPGVYALEVLPVLPDFTLWRYPCAQVIFDDDPARKNQSLSEQKEEVNQAMIRGMVDETGDHFVAYFLPTDETRNLRKLDAENQSAFTEGATYEYELAREYNWNVKNKTMANYEENYFFVFRNDGVFYNELETRVRLSKRRKLQPHSQTGGSRFPSSQSKTRLIVQHRDFTDDELQTQTARLYMLEHESETEGEEEEEEEEENELEDEGRRPEGSGEDRNGGDDDDGDDADKATAEEEDEDDAEEDENNQQPNGAIHSSGNGSADESVRAASASPDGSVTSEASAEVELNPRAMQKQPASFVSEMEDSDDLSSLSD